MKSRNANMNLANPVCKYRTPILHLSTLSSCSGIAYEDASLHSSYTYPLQPLPDVHGSTLQRIGHVMLISTRS